MAAWRRRALELFPQLRQELTGRDYSVYLLFFELKPMLTGAFDVDDEILVRRIFNFAEWCSRQTAWELWNAAGVAFYEHVFDEPQYSDRVIPWLSPRASSSTTGSCGISGPHRRSGTASGRCWSRWG